jgi:hypothetical protein
MKPESSLLSPATSPRVTAGDKILLVKGIAGLGNRILCAMGAVLYARLSGRRLVIDWTDPLYSSNGDNVFHRLFTSRACSPADAIPSMESVYPALWSDRLDQSARQVVVEKHYNPDEVRRELSLDSGKLDYAEDLLVMVEYDAPVGRMRHHFRGPFQELAAKSTSDILAQLLREDLVLAPDVRSRVNDFKRRKFNSHVIGVHVRYSDYRVRLLAIIKQLNALLKKKPDSQIFLATDNIEIQKMFERSYRGVVTTPHWYANPGKPIHKSATNSRRLESAIEGLVDMYLLAECEHLIFDASSTFSEVSSFLSDAPSQNKVDVSAGDPGKGNRRARETMTRILRRARFSSWAFRLLPRLVPIRKL